MSAETLEAIFGTPKPLPLRRSQGEAAVNLLSFDIEDWFHAETMRQFLSENEWQQLPLRLEPHVERILGLLEKHRVTATFFILGWIAERTPGTVRAIASAGHEIASHGYWHRMITTQKPQEFQDDVVRSLTAIEEATGCRAVGYRAPTFSITKGTTWALSKLSEAGFVYDSSVFPIRHDRYGIPNAPRFPFRVPRDLGGIMEFPLATVSTRFGNVPFGGGGYLRIYPYFVTSGMIRRLNREGLPVVVYLHPWEFDPGQPRVPGLSALSQARHYTGLNRTYRRLNRLLEEFPFQNVGSMGEDGLHG